MIGSSLKMSSMEWPPQGRQALLFVPDGLLEAVENRLCLPFHGDPPSQRTYLKRFRKA